jgi:hypothetical protein
MMPAHDVAKYFVSLVDEEAGDSISISKCKSSSITLRVSI